MDNSAISQRPTLFAVHTEHCPPVSPNSIAEVRGFFIGLSRRECQSYVDKKVGPFGDGPNRNFVSNFRHTKVRGSVVWL